MAKPEQFTLFERCISEGEKMFIEVEVELSVAKPGLHLYVVCSWFLNTCFATHRKRPILWICSLIQEDLASMQVCAGLSLRLQEHRSENLPLEELLQFEVKLFECSLLT
jgi:hypothetical protein